jgi:hypothetical protein
VTDDDTVVYAIEATGLDGYEATQPGSLETGTDLDEIAGLEFTVWTAHDTLTLSGAWPRRSGHRRTQTGPRRLSHRRFR